MKKPLVAAAFQLSVAPVVAANDTAVALASDSSTPLRSAVDQVRSTGVALWEWYRDSRRPMPPLPGGESDSPIEIGRANPIDAAAARQRALPLVVVERLEGVDPWGHAYEVRLGDGRQAPTLVVRSAGANGRFEGDRYATGAFTSGDRDDDIVWADGFFVRWPEKR
jgi:hypothetical protein